MSKQIAVIESQCCVPLADAPLNTEQAVDVARAFKALADPARLRLLSMIVSAAGEVCVCDMTSAFDLSGPTISHHLKVLRETGLVDCERRGTWVYYWPVPGRLQWLSSLLAAPGLGSGSGADGRQMNSRRQS